MLLLLDNFEQVIQAAPVLTDLLAAAPHLKLLVTSRMMLHLYGEHDYAVQPLALPDKQSAHLLTPEQSERYDAVRLFVERAQAAKAGFALDVTSAPAVAEICRRLDGLPLAIELAAARVGLLPPKAMLKRIDSQALSGHAGRLKLLSAGPRDIPRRQQTLLDTIEWSYDLLDEAEKRLFGRMAVFSGGRSLPAIEAVCDFEGDLGIDPLEGVSSLVDKSLLRQEEGLEGEPRFVMLETIHEYTRDKLAASPDAEVMLARHARYFLSFVEEGVPHLVDEQQALWLSRLEEEHDNIRACLRWARERGELGDEEALDLGMRMAGLLWQFWEGRAHLAEGREQCESIAAVAARQLQIVRDAGGQVSPDREKAYARVIAAGGILASDQGNYGLSRRIYEQCLEIYKRLGDDLRVANLLNNLGVVTGELGDDRAALAYFEESLQIKRDLGNKLGVANTLMNIGTIIKDQGDYATARRYLEESLHSFRELGDRRSVANDEMNLGNLSYMEGDIGAARLLYEDALAIFIELDHRWGVAYAQSSISLASSRQGGYEVARSLSRESLIGMQAMDDRWGIINALVGLACAALGGGVEGARRSALLLGVASRLIETTPRAFKGVAKLEYERAIAVAQEALGSQAYVAAFEAGRAMSAEAWESSALMGPE